MVADVWKHRGLRAADAAKRPGLPGAADITRAVPRVVAAEGTAEAGLREADAEAKRLLQHAITTNEPNGRIRAHRSPTVGFLRKLVFRLRTFTSVDRLFTPRFPRGCFHRVGASARTVLHSEFVLGEGTYGFGIRNAALSWRSMGARVRFVCHVCSGIPGRQV